MVALVLVYSCLGQQAPWQSLKHVEL